jgi:hypothetical protein
VGPNWAQFFVELQSMGVASPSRFGALDRPVRRFRRTEKLNRDAYSDRNRRRQQVAGWPQESTLRVTLPSISLIQASIASRRYRR